MDRRLQNLYSEVELPLATILAEMHRSGIGVNRTECQREFNSLLPTEKTLLAKIAAGDSVNLRSDSQVFKFLSAKGIVFDDPLVNQARKVTADALDEAANLTRLPVI